MTVPLLFLLDGVSLSYEQLGHGAHTSRGQEIKGMQCPNCGQDNRGGAKFCDECGTPLSAQPVQTDPVQTHDGRRQLTVMFCDVVGSIALAGRLDPEEWRDIIQVYQETCATVVRRFSGYIAQYLGDGLLVYFGYPITHEDDAVRAIKTGLGILAELQAMNARLKEPGRARLFPTDGKESQGIRLRIGIHTGQVVVGNMGAGERHEQLALGETRNIAARLQSIAKADTMVISAATFRLVEGFFECHTLGPHALKGITTPLSVYHVIAEGSAQSRFGGCARSGSDSARRTGKRPPISPRTVRRGQSPTRPGRSLRRGPGH